MTDKKTVEAVAQAIHDEIMYEQQPEAAQAAIQAYQDNATIDDFKVMAKRLGVSVVPTNVLHDLVSEHPYPYSSTECIEARNAIKAAED